MNRDEVLDDFSEMLRHVYGRIQDSELQPNEIASAHTELMVSAVLLLVDRLDAILAKLEERD